MRPVHPTIWGVYGASADLNYPEPLVLVVLEQRPDNSRSGLPDTQKAFLSSFASSIPLFSVGVLVGQGSQMQSCMSGSLAMLKDLFSAGCHKVLI